ncbi:MAG TPA: hypothetical protein VGB63_09915 [Pedobacter sp.]
MSTISRPHTYAPRKSTPSSAKIMEGRRQERWAERKAGLEFA